MESYFKLRQRGVTVGTEVRAGLTTFMVMAYIIFVNPNIISRATGDAGPPFEAVVVVTALAAGILTISMGLLTNYPFALAAGLGLNAVVAFDLILGRQLPWEQAMAIIVWEGILIFVLVLTGLREAVMAAIPMNLKRAIAVGIGLFILFIGLFNGGFVIDTFAPPGLESPPPPVDVGQLTNVAVLTFVIGLGLTLALMARRVKGALLIGILASTVVAVVLKALVGAEQSGFHPATAALPTTIDGYIFNFDPANFAIIFAPLGEMLNVLANPQLGFITVALVIFSLMMADFFDTMGTVIGVSEEAGLLDEGGQLPGIRNVLLVDSAGAILGGAFGVSSNTTYIESAAGVSEGGRTGLTAVVVGILFLVAILFAPIAGIVPAQATAPALVIVGFLMFTIARDFDWSAEPASATGPAAGEEHDWRTPSPDTKSESRIDEIFPVLATVIVMPLTFSITDGIAAGFVTYGFLKLVTGRMREVHPLMWAASIAFAIYFAAPWLEVLIG